MHIQRHSLFLQHMKHVSFKSVHCVISSLNQKLKHFSWVYLEIFSEKKKRKALIKAWKKQGQVFYQKLQKRIQHFNQHCGMYLHLYLSDRKIGACIVLHQQCGGADSCRWKVSCHDFKNDWNYLCSRICNRYLQRIRVSGDCRTN